ncbi:cyclase family protein [Bradyrhizobium barranii]
MMGNCDLLDLSVPLGPGPSNAVPVEIQYMPHEAGGRHLAHLVGTTPECLCGGEAWASERVSGITHSGTHVDAPFHYASHTGAKPSRTIDEMPLDWFWGPGKCIRVDRHPSDILIALDELLAFEAQTGIEIKAGDIALFDTGAQRFWGTDEYNNRGRGFDPALIQHLVGRGVKVIGTDAWSLDPPYWVMRKRLQERGPKTVWSAHYVGRDSEFCAIEKLTNLDRLPAEGFHVAAFPVKVERGSAGWARVVGFVPRHENLHMGR